MLHFHSKFLSRKMLFVQTSSLIEGLFRHLSSFRSLSFCFTLVTLGSTPAGRGINQPALIKFYRRKPMSNRVSLLYLILVINKMDSHYSVEDGPGEVDSDDLDEAGKFRLHMFLIKWFIRIYHFLPFGLSSPGVIAGCKLAI